MDTAGKRLRQAREKYFPSAAAAAAALGIPPGTYSGHENGNRGFPKDRAPVYAKKFKVTEEWLLYGKGPETAPDPIPDEETLIGLVQEIIDAEYRIETRVSDLPHMIGSGLRKSLELLADLGKAGPTSGVKTARDRPAQSPAATTQADQEGSHSS